MDFCGVWRGSDSSTLELSTATFTLTTGTLSWRGSCRRAAREDDALDLGTIVVCDLLTTSASVAAGVVSSSSAKVARAHRWRPIKGAQPARFAVVQPGFAQIVERTTGASHPSSPAVLVRLWNGRSTATATMLPPQQAEAPTLPFADRTLAFARSALPSSTHGVANADELAVRVAARLVAARALRMVHEKAAETWRSLPCDGEYERPSVAAALARSALLAAAATEESESLSDPTTQHAFAAKAEQEEEGKRHLEEEEMKAEATAAVDAEANIRGGAKEHVHEQGKEEEKDAAAPRETRADDARAAEVLQRAMRPTLARMAVGRRIDELTDPLSLASPMIIAAHHGRVGVLRAMLGDPDAAAQELVTDADGRTASDVLLARHGISLGSLREGAASSGRRRY